MAPTVTTIDRETFVAQLATAAYQVALRHGIKGSFAELELAMWRELRTVCDDAEPVVGGNS